MNADRRTAERHAVELDAEINLGSGPVRSALTHDASERGVLLLTNEDLEIGQKVAVSCRLDHALVTTVGKVVRKEPSQDSRWRMQVGVELSIRDPLVGEIFRKLARR